MNNKEILQKAKELVELLEKQEETGKVELSTLKRGEVFQTTETAQINTRQHVQSKLCGVRESK